MKKFLNRIFLIVSIPMLMLLAGCGDSLPHEETVTKLLQQAYEGYYGTVVPLKDFSVKYDNVEEIRKGVYRASAIVTFTKDLSELRRNLQTEAKTEEDGVIKMMILSYTSSHKDMVEQLRGEKSPTETHVVQIKVKYAGEYVKIEYDKKEFE